MIDLQAGIAWITRCRVPLPKLNAAHSQGRPELSNASRIYRGGLIVVYNCFFGALTPHTDNRICAQTVSKRRFVHLDAQQLPPPLLLYTQLARFRTHYESPASLNARRHSQVSCLAGRADRVVSAVGRSGTAARRPAYSRACSCAFCSTIVHSRTRDSPSLVVLRK